MRTVNLRCLMMGHDDRVRRSRGRMYLECDECGRQTSGWNVSGKPDEARGGAMSPLAPLLQSTARHLVLGARALQSSCERTRDEVAMRWLAWRRQHP